MTNLKPFSLANVLFTLFMSAVMGVPSAMSSISKDPISTTDLSKGTGTVEFLAIGKPSALRIHGIGKEISGNFSVHGNLIEGSATFPLNTLATGIDTRDHHMKEKYLETSKFPNATLRISKVALPHVIPAGDFSFKEIPFEGPLTLHGQTKNVRGTMTVARAAGQMLVQAQFGLKISDYAVSIPSFAGIVMADEVNVDVHTNSPSQSSGTPK